MTSTTEFTSEQKRPKVGVGVIIKKDDKILLGKRINAHGHNTWNFPGGHLEFGETPEECAVRETMEEAGITIKNVVRGPWTNDYNVEAENHYITIYMIADYDAGEVKVMEPEKCALWSWFTWDSLPEPLFLPIKNLMKLHFNPFSSKE